MKKSFKLFLYILLCLFILTPNSAICDNLNKQYIKEINKAINSQIIVSKKNINNIFREVKNEKNPYIRQVAIEQGINEILFEFYVQLIDITDSYVKIKHLIPITDYHEDLGNFIISYLKNNNIDTSKINSFLNYSYKKETLLKQKYGN